MKKTILFSVCSVYLPQFCRFFTGGCIVRMDSARGTCCPQFCKTSPLCLCSVHWLDRSIHLDSNFCLYCMLCVFVVDVLLRVRTVSHAISYQVLYCNWICAALHWLILRFCIVLHCYCVACFWRNALQGVSSKSVETLAPLVYEAHCVAQWFSLLLSCIVIFLFHESSWRVCLSHFSQRQRRLRWVLLADHYFHVDEISTSDTLKAKMTPAEWIQRKMQSVRIDQNRLCCKPSTEIVAHLTCSVKFCVVLLDSRAFDWLVAITLATWIRFPTKNTECYGVPIDFIWFSMILCFIFDHYHVLDFRLF